MSVAGVSAARQRARDGNDGDLSLAGLLLTTSLVVLFAPSVQAGITLGQRPPRGLDLVTAAVVVAQSVPLFWRRRHPLLVGAVVGLAFAAGQILAVPPTPSDFGALVAVYSAAAYGDAVPVWVVWVAATAAWWGLFAALPGLELGSLGSVATLYVLLVVVPLVLGTRLRQRRSGLLQEQVARARAERERDEAEQSHHDAIARAGRQALTDLRHLVGAPAVAGLAVDGPVPQPPGLAALDDLLARARAQGLDAELSVEGDPRPLPLGVDVSAYRIVEEALGNAVRHGRAPRARVAVRYAADELELEVVDEGRASPTAVRAGAEVGRGVINMRERAALFGGTFSAAARPGGGFQVRASLRTA